jgi:hypothetical protein
VKIHVNEEVRAALAVDAEAKVEWEASRAERRLEEVRVLLRERAATPETIDALEARFEEHEQRVEAVIGKIEADARADVAARVSSRFEATLAAHKELIESLSVTADAETIATVKSAPAVRMLEKISQAKDKARSIRERTEKEVTDVKSAKRAGEQAASKLRTASGISAKLKARLGGEEGGAGVRMLASLDASILAAEKLVAAGDASMRDGRYNDAFRSYNEAVRELRGAEIAVTGDWSVDRTDKKVADADDADEREADAVADAKVAVTVPVVEKMLDVVVQPGASEEKDDDADARLRADAEGKRGYAVTEIARLRARIAAFAEDGYDWSEGEDELAIAEARLIEGDASFSAARYADAYASFKEAYHVAYGTAEQEVRVPSAPEEPAEDDDVDAEARARAEMKRGYAVNALEAYEASIAVKIEAVGEEHEYVVQMRARLAAGERKVAEGDELFAAGSYDEAYEAYLGTWGELN